MRSVFFGGGYGIELKRGLRRLYGCDVHFAGRGEMIPNEHSYCEIDPNVVDQWGIPVLRFHFKWSQDEILQAKHMQETFKQIIETMGGTVTDSYGGGGHRGSHRGGGKTRANAETQMGAATKGPQ